MSGIPAVMDFAFISSLEFVGSLTDDLGDLVGSFPIGAQLACCCFFGILENLA